MVTLADHSDITTATCCGRQATTKQQRSSKSILLAAAQTASNKANIIYQKQSFSVFRLKEHWNIELQSAVNT